MKSTKPKSKWVGPRALLAVGVLIVAVLVAGVWQYFQTAQAPRGSGWRVYRSTHSDVQFSYPASWQVVQGHSGGYILEQLTLKGPNNFQLYYELSVDHVNPALSCARTDFGPTVPLNHSYVIVPTLDSDHADEIREINLMAASYAGSSAGCGLGFYPNQIGNSLGFVFAGGYVEPNDENGGVSISKPTLGYFDRLEVRTAKQVWASFRP